MLRIAVCDDDRSTAVQIKLQLQAQFLGEHQPVLLDVYTDPTELARKTDYNVYFLDIDMPGLNGLQLAEQLRREQKQLGKRALIIYVSSFDDMVYQTFPLEPFGFIRKSYFEAEIPAMVHRILEKMQTEKKDALVFEDHGHIITLSCTEIVYIESFDKRQIIHTRKGQYPLSGTMTGLQQRLTEYGFLRIHKSYLVNYRHILTMDKTGLRLQDGTELPVSKYRAGELRQAYCALLAAEL